MQSYAEAASAVVRTLYSLPLAADSRLVASDADAGALPRRQASGNAERLWLVGMSCLGVGLSATLTVPLLWRLFAWMGEWAGSRPWFGKRASCFSSSRRHWW